MYSEILPFEFHFLNINGQQLVHPMGLKGEIGGQCLSGTELLVVGARLLLPHGWIGHSCVLRVLCDCLGPPCIPRVLCGWIGPHCVPRVLCGWVVPPCVPRVPFAGGQSIKYFRNLCCHHLCPFALQRSSVTLWPRGFVPCAAEDSKEILGPEASLFTIVNQ